MHPILSRAALALLALAAAPHASAAQDPVTKPTPTLTYRLPAPSPIVARQIADGRIVVQWRAVSGAAKYQVTRSVPPTVAQVVALPSDTMYTDAAVKAGSMYYYVVAAMDSSGLIGLKVGSQPVTATMDATVTTTDAAGGATTTTVALVAPTAIRILDRTPPSVDVYWTFTQSGMRYRVERAIVPDAGAKVAPSWQIRQTTDARQCCMWSAADSAPSLPLGSRYLYRVSTVDPAEPTRVSAPIVSQPSYPFSIGTWPFSTNAFRLPETYFSDYAMRVGQSVHFYRPGSSTNPEIVTVDAAGNAVAKSAGVAYVSWVELGTAGEPFVKLLRVTVTP